MTSKIQKSSQLKQQSNKIINDQIENFNSGLTNKKHISSS
jgi:hypothetical protein